MNKTIYLTLSGLFMFSAGLILLFSTTIGVGISKIMVPLFFFVSGILAFMFSRANGQHKIAKTFHLLQGVGLMTFAVIIAIWPDTLTMFLKITTYFVMVYGLFELMFAFSVLRSSYKLDVSILITRLLVGLVNLVGSFILFMALWKSTGLGLQVAGFLIVLGGIGFMRFASRVKKHR